MYTLPNRTGPAGKSLEQVLDGEADEETLILMEKTARAIEITADCAMGWEAARMVLAGIKGLRMTLKSISTTTVVCAISSSRCHVLPCVRQEWISRVT